MNSFIGISKAQTTNLAAVAPGIAEALLATAFGLAAAIPAVVIYNVFARQIAAYRAQLAATSAETLRLASRDLDRRTGARKPVPAAAERGTDDERPSRPRPGRARRGPRDQRHALHRRDAGPAHHLHGGGAARDGGHLGQPADCRRAAAAAPAQAALSHGQAGPFAVARRRSGLARRARPGARAGNQWG